MSYIARWLLLNDDSFPPVLPVYGIVLMSAQMLLSRLVFRYGGQVVGDHMEWLLTKLIFGGGQMVEDLMQWLFTGSRFA